MISAWTTLCPAGWVATGAVARAGVDAGAVEAAAARAVRSAASTKPMPLTKRAALTTNSQ